MAIIDMALFLAAPFVAILYLRLLIWFDDRFAQREGSYQNVGMSESR